MLALAFAALCAGFIYYVGIVDGPALAVFVEA